MYEIMNMTYSPLRVILADNSEVIMGSRISEDNTITVDQITDQLKALADKNFLRVKSL